MIFFEVSGAMKQASVIVKQDGQMSDRYRECQTGLLVADAMKAMADGMITTIYTPDGTACAAPHVSVVRCLHGIGCAAQAMGAGTRTGRQTLQGSRWKKQ